MFSVVDGTINHILNETDHGLLKKAQGIGQSSQITEESVLNFPSALSIRTTMGQLFQTYEVVVYQISKNLHFPVSFRSKSNAPRYFVAP
jgi:hypothetical protein